MGDPFTILIIAATFVLAGLVKGVIGLGLPTVSLGLLTVAFDLPQAMALMLVPSLVTNLWQGFVGGHATALLKRLWPFLLPAGAAVLLGARALSGIDFVWLSLLLGLLLVIYAGLSLAGVKMVIPPQREPIAGPVAGLVNGVLTGMTGSFVVPGVAYLQGLGLPRDQFVQAMGLLFSVSTIALAIALQRTNLLTGDMAIASTLGVLPAMVGMWIGVVIRQRISEPTFRQVFFVAVAVLGAYIIARSLAAAF